MLEAYLKRISYTGALQTDKQTLGALMQAHITAIPFENLDVQLGRNVRAAPEAVYKKIVDNNRGGWCYEMNGLFGWALGEIGFDVTRLVGGVMRVHAGDQTLGNHLALLITLDRPYLVDVGFGGALTSPLPLIEQEIECPPFNITLMQLDQDYWRFGEDYGNGAFSYDFRTAPADEELLNTKSASQQTDAQSNFVLNLVAQIRAGDTHKSLRGRVYKEISPTGENKRLIETPQDLRDTLTSEFDLDVPDIAACWEKIHRRHTELFGD